MRERFDIGFEFANDWGEIARFLRGSDILVSLTRAYNRIRQCLDRRAVSGYDLIAYAGDVPLIAINLKKRIVVHCQIGYCQMRAVMSSK